MTWEQPASSPRRRSRRFPAAMSIFANGRSTLKLGEHQENPLFNLTTHSGWFGRPTLTLRSGPSKKDPVLATVKPSPRNQIGKGFSVVLSNPQSQLPQSPSAARPIASFDTVQVEGGIEGPTRGVFRFELKVGSGWERRLETFEWRYITRRPDSNYSRPWTGWELLRLDAGWGEEFEETGGKEVVAIWADAIHGAQTQAGFAFVNSGATGQLGDRWAIMAVITAMAIWDEQRRVKHVE